MLYLAYLSVDGFGELSSECIKLHDGFGKLCSDTKIKLREFGHSGKAVQDRLMDAVYALFNEDDPGEAAESIRDCAQIAVKLSDGAKNLSEKFENLGDQTVGVQQAVVKQKGITEDKKAEVQKSIDNYKAEQSGLKVKLEKLSQQKKRLENLYKEAAEEAKKADEKAFTMGLVNAIMTPLATGLGTAVSHMSPLSQTNQLLSFASHNISKINSNISDGLGKAELEKLKNKLELEQGNLETKISAQTQLLTKLRNDKDEVEKQISLLKENLQKTPDQEKIKSEIKHLEESLKTKLSKINEEDQKLKEIEKDKSIQAAQLQSLASSFAQAAKSAGQAHESYMALAQKIREEKTQYLRMLDEKEQEEAASLGKQAELASRVSASALIKDNLGTAITGLYLAQGALSKVAVALRMTSDFWKQMASHCENLSSNQFENDITKYSNRVRKKVNAGQKELTVSQTINEVVPNHVKIRIVEYFAGWKALEEISNYFGARVEDVQKQVWNDFKANLHGEALYRKISELSGQQFEELNKQMNAKRKAIEDRQTEN